MAMRIIPISARALGVDTIAQASVAAHAPMIRAHFGLPETRLILCAISFGYGDADHPDLGAGAWGGHDRAGFGRGACADDPGAFRPARDAADPVCDLVRVWRCGSSRSRRGRLGWTRSRRLRSRRMRR